jgi:hypothetical protein
MKFAYADPPYLGCGNRYLDNHPAALDWNDAQTHFNLIRRLCDEYPDGWGLSASSPSLRVLLPECPAEARVGSWVKPFAVFRPNVGVAYAWEPVIFCGGRRISREEATVRDWVSCPITLERGLVGAKPRDFCWWIFSVLNAQVGDTLDDLFPGTNAVGAAWAEWVGEQSPLPQLPLFEQGAA